MDTFIAIMLVILSAIGVAALDVFYPTNEPILYWFIGATTGLVADTIIS